MDASRLDRVKSSQDERGCVDWVSRLVRSRAVSSVAYDFDFYDRGRRKDAAVANPYLACCEIGHVVTAVDFVDPIEASFLNHRFRPPWAFFGWLEEQAD